MKFADLKTTLKSSLAPVYLLHGTDYYLVSKAIELITDAANVNKDLDVSRLDDTAAAQEIISECRTVSFLGGKRVVIVKPFAQEINEYFKKPNCDCVLILVSNEEKTAIKNIETVDCNPMQPDLLIKLIANALSKHGKKITPDAANLLCNFCGNLYSRIDGELNKLVNYFVQLDIIGMDEINQIVTKTQDYQIYELSNAILSSVDGNLKRAEGILRTLQGQGTDDYAIFGNLVGAIRRIFYSLSCKASNESVAAVLGCSPYAVGYARRDYRFLTNKIAKLYSFVLDLEYQIKSGKISVHNAIILCYSVT